MGSLRYIDAFCGLGGFSIAAHIFNLECVYAIDNNKDVANTFYNNFNINPLGDIRTIDKSTLPDHDILFGGFPCQPFSRNGKWYNNNNKIIPECEERDNLFVELLHILTCKQPKYFIFENVKGLLSMKNKDNSSYYDTIISGLKICGYKVYAEVLDLADYGIPQQRKRIFFVGHRNDIINNFKFPNKIPRTTAIKDILLEADTKYLLSNLWKNRKINLSVSGKHKKNHNYEKGHSRYDVIKEIYDISTKTITKGKINTLAILYGDTPSGLPRQQDKIYSIEGIAPTIATFSIPAVNSYSGLRQLTPRECARLQSIPDSYKLPHKDSIAYKQIGNAVPPVLIAYLLKELLK